MKKKLIIIFIFASYLNLYSQSNDFDRIEFGNSNSMMISDSNVEVSIFPAVITKDSISIKVMINNKNVEKYISKRQYKNLSNLIKKINPIDLTSTSEDWLDGTTTYISFKNKSTSIKYSVEGLFKNDKWTKRKDFLEAVQLILFLTDIKIPELN